MTVKANTAAVAMSVAWEQTKTISTSFANAKQGGDSLSFKPSINTTTYNEVLLTEFSLASASGNTNTVDFYSYTDSLGTAVTATKIKALIVRSYGAGNTNGAKMTMEPGASNALVWFFGAANQSITLECGTTGCGLMIIDGNTEVVSATLRNVKFSNPGNTNSTVQIAALLGD